MTKVDRSTFPLRTKSDARHLPVALASITAKYVRELFLRRLNHYFQQRIPGLKATAGYPQDAARFLREIEPHLPETQRSALVRNA